MSWGNPKTTREKLMKSILTPLSELYKAGNYLRFKSYKNGILNAHKFPVPVISIGNITCGGTGKTPLTIDLAKRLTNAGYKVGILSRGYGRKSGKTIVVSDGTGNLADCEESGDEPFVIAKLLPEVGVVVSADRIKAGKLAIDKLGCNLLLLDDGFQNLRVARTHDIVLIDYNDEPENDALLPAGRLREPLSALGRASMIIITKIPDNPDPERLEKLVSLIKQYNTRAEFGFVQFKARRLRDANGTVTPITDLIGSNIFAFCGLARSDQFFQMIEQKGVGSMRTMRFPDHHWYSAADLGKIIHRAKSARTDLFITTAKDLVKLEIPTSLKSQFRAIELETLWLSDFNESLPPSLTALIKAASQLKPITK
jgi:tetraacyldisaccharide 4'-kinase